MTSGITPITAASNGGTDSQHERQARQPRARVRPAAGDPGLSPDRLSAGGPV